MGSAAERVLALGYAGRPAGFPAIQSTGFQLMVCPVLEPAGPWDSCWVFWRFGTSAPTAQPRPGHREAGLGGALDSCPGAATGGLRLETELTRGMQKFPKAAPAALHQLGTDWGCVGSLLWGEASLQKVRSKQQLLLQKNAVSHILHQLIFFWRANHCSFENGTKELSLTSFSASLQYSVHQMCAVYQKIQMLQLSFGIT